jgi:hypothetical protein
LAREPRESAQRGGAATKAQATEKMAAKRRKEAQKPEVFLAIFWAFVRPIGSSQPACTYVRSGTKKACFSGWGCGALAAVARTIDAFRVICVFRGQWIGGLLEPTGRRGGGTAFPGVNSSGRRLSHFQNTASLRRDRFERSLLHALIPGRSGNLAFVCL